MEKCYGTASFLILMNSSSVDYFFSSKGLRQEDPLSPFFFLVVAEAFGALISKAFQGGLMEGFMMGENGMTISHLQFANDILVFCKNFTSQRLLLRCVLRCFEALLGMKVNLSKSCIYGVGQVSDLWRFMEMLGCEMGALSFASLGLLLGAPYKCKEVWNLVLERIHKRLV